MISKLRDDNMEIEELASDITPLDNGSYIGAPESPPKVVKFKANVSNDGDEVASQRTY